MPLRATLLAIFFAIASCASAKAPTSTQGTVIWWPKDYFEGEQFIHVVKLHSPAPGESPYVYYIEMAKVRQYWVTREVSRIDDNQFFVTTHYEVWLNLEPEKAAKREGLNDQKYLRYYTEEQLSLVVSGPGLRPSAVTIFSWGNDKYYVQVAKLYDKREKLSPAAPAVPTQEAGVEGK
jgi:hypothetical protein